MCNYDNMSGKHVEESERVRAKRDEAPGARHHTTREGGAGQKSDRGDCHELENGHTHVVGLSRHR